ncbi:MAG: nucleotidyltransferase domain-containing protein [Candidatus Hydrogenedentes bacterium]|nr:nucleotidyltransferase domain-containing protein [Candidatus Hydrogenedentota bacterium]MBI3118581.1 nucleotidyltransferase domain-containing protein [Candidatus Hydrogenedentota bacterium]
MASDILRQLLGSALRADALSWLLTHPDERFYVRQLSKILHVNSTNLSRELARLEMIGVIQSTLEGHQKYFAADRSSPLFPDLEGLAIKTAGMAEVLEKALAPVLDKINAAFIFGSFAEKRANQHSDVDCMIIGALSLADVVELFEPAAARLRREVNPRVFPLAEFRRKLREGNHFITHVMRATKVFLVGDEHELKRIAQ